VSGRMGDTLDPMFIELAEFARAGRLTIYTGAGLSTAAPSSVPGGTGIVELMRDVLERQGIETKKADGSTQTLEAVADAAFDAGLLPGMKEVAAALSVFHRKPNIGHELAAILVSEGFIRLLSANWDPYVEEGGAHHGVRLTPTVTDHDRLHRLGAHSFHKVHGCVSQPGSLLVGTQELRDPPPWAIAEVSSALGGGVVVFLGIGTVADYVGTRVKQGPGFGWDINHSLGC